jgi:hypothetical protein
MPALSVHVETRVLPSGDLTDLWIRRREIGEQFKDLTAEPLRTQIFERNLERYGDPLGPSIEWLRTQGKSWDDIIESALRTGGRRLGVLMLLLSHDRFDLVAEFEPVEGELLEFERSDAGDLINQPMLGHYAHLAELLAVLYRSAGGLRLRLGDLDFGIESATRVDWSSDGVTSTLNVEVEGELLSFRYPSGPSLAGDPTPFVEPEHFDFGLFVANVANDPARLERMYQAP